MYIALIKKNEEKNERMREIYKSALNQSLKQKQKVLV